MCVCACVHLIADWSIRTTIRRVWLVDNQFYVMHAHRRVISGWKSSPLHSTAHQPTTTTTSCTKRSLIFFKALQRSSIIHDRTLVGVTWYSLVLPFDLYRKLLVIWNACRITDWCSCMHLLCTSLLGLCFTMQCFLRQISGMVWNLEAIRGMLDAK